MATPTVSALSSQVGSYYGGETITVTGTGFDVSFPIVKFGDFFGNSVNVISPTSLTVVTPYVGENIEADLTVTTTDGTSSVVQAARFFFYSPLSSPTYTSNNVYFDQNANYIYYGDVVFVKNPLFASGGGGGAFDPANSYTFTGDEQFNGGFGVLSPSSVVIGSTGSNLILGATTGMEITTNNGGLNINALNGNLNLASDSFNVSISGTLESTIAAQGGALTISSATNLTLNAASVLLPTLTPHVGDLAAPTIRPASGFFYIVSDGSGNLFRMAGN